MESSSCSSSAEPLPEPNPNNPYPHTDHFLQSRPASFIKRATVASIQIHGSNSGSINSHSHDSGDESDESGDGGGSAWWHGTVQDQANTNHTDSHHGSGPHHVAPHPIQQHRHAPLLLRKQQTDLGLLNPGWRTRKALVAQQHCDSSDSSLLDQSVRGQSSRNSMENASRRGRSSLGLSTSLVWSLSSSIQRKKSSSSSGETSVTQDTIRTLADSRPSLKDLPLEEFISEDSLEMQSDEFDRTVLGAGGQGRIFLATLRPAGEKVAVKVSNKENVLQEYILSSKLRHPNIVKPIGFSVARLSGLSTDAVSEDSDEWVNMAVYEYCRYGDLMSFLEEHPKMSTDRTFLRRVFHSVLSALAHLHAAGYVHCDIKPGNILVGENYEIKVGDLGMCQQISSTMNAQGTPSYLAPEVVMAWCGPPGKHSFTDKIDIFSIGVTLVHIIARQYPFNRITARLKSRLPVPSSEFSLHFKISEQCMIKLKLIDLKYADIASKCLEVDPTKRPSAAELLMGLEQQAVASNATKNNNNVAKSL